MPPHNFGAEGRIAAAPYFTTFLHLQAGATRWLNTQTFKKDHVSPSAAGPVHALFDTQLLAIPFIAQCFGRAVQTPQALSHLAMLWLALDLRDQRVRRSPHWQGRTEFQALESLSMRPPTAVHPAPNSERLEQWEAFFTLDPHARWNVMLPHLQPALCHELHCLSLLQRSTPSVDHAHTPTRRETRESHNHGADLFERSVHEVCTAFYPPAKAASRGSQERLSAPSSVHEVHR